MSRALPVCGLLVLGLLVVAPAAFATTTFHRRAPAPLLAAGLPAFAAVGGGAGILRLVRGKFGRTKAA